jgi:hypothetical protein
MISADEGDEEQTMPLFGRNNDVDLLIVDQNTNEPLPWTTIETTMRDTRQSTRLTEKIQARGTDDIGTATKPPTNRQSDADTYNDFLPETDITATRQWHTQTTSLLTWIEKAIKWKPISPFDKSDFKFEVTMEAARHNYRVLEQHDFDLQQIISSTRERNTPLRPGSEFWPLYYLEPIFRGHPLWWRARKMIAEGFSMPLAKLPDVNRVADVFKAINYGNHKSTLKNPEIVLEMLGDEVARGWQLVLPCDRIASIPETIVSPLGLVNQNTINETGQTVTKWRLTHDQ